ncbi:MAG: hypothetical protein KJO80_03615 [Gammaproteobacteria bacterium]|nr:hypothetical protein [Gammaproteobacteria bacterium]MBT8072864.1 hypothetical protein [Gammaproteobacteria bacterium]
MKKLNLKYGLVALAGLGLSANVSATDLTCSDVVFTPEAYAAYEFIDKACLEMVDRNGRTFAKMTARIVAQTSSATHVRFRDANGELGPNHRSGLPRNFEILSSGKPVRLRDVAVRQEVNVYISDEFWAAPAAEVAEAVAAPAAAAAPPPPPPAPEPEPAPEMLPTTAGPLPWLALFGSLFLILGGALRLSRKQ